MTIKIGASAIAEIKRMQKTWQHPECKLRLGIAAGGCERWYYTIEPTTATTANDLEYTIDGIVVTIASEHLPYLDRLKLDYTQDLMGGAFQFQNPQAQKVCGCGNSFSATIDN
jgi:iron-sulfur cluster assembly protein